MNKKNIIKYGSLVIGGICLIVLIFSVIKISSWFVDNHKIEKIEKEIEAITEIKEIEDNEKTEIIEPPKEIKKEDPYWDYIKMNLINVDFGELKKKNSDTKGWIQVNGTYINYPFVQTDNNDFYLNHSFDKTHNEAGWVFMDYRNNIAEFDKNTIIYAHGRLNKRMFGSLKNILTSGWLNNKDNYIIKLSTEYENTLWQVISVYHIPTTNDYIQTEFKSDDEFINFGNKLINRSAHDFKTTINKDDKILTLSTCYNETEKVVMHAKLIKVEKKQ